VLDSTESLVLLSDLEEGVVELKQKRVKRKHNEDTNPNSKPFKI